MITCLSRIDGYWRADMPKDSTCRKKAMISKQLEAEDFWHEFRVFTAPCLQKRIREDC